MNTTFAVESETGIAVSTARKRTLMYVEDGAEPLGRFVAKSLCGKGQLCWAFQKGGA